MAQAPVSNAVNDAIAAAAAAAGASATALAGAAGALAVDPATQAVATTQQAGVPAVAGTKLTMETMLSGLSVDIWIGVKEMGLLFGPNKLQVVKPVQVIIDLAAIQPCQAIKFGNPAKYYKTYDLVREASGGSWADALANVARAAPMARPYPSADLPMICVEEVKDIMGEVCAEPGKVLGNSLSTTNWGEWKSFYDLCVRSGLAGERVIANLGFKKRTNPAGNIWGVITFSLVGAANS